MQVVHFINSRTPVEYTAMLERQIRVRDQVAEGKVPNTVFLIEHEPTITLGRRAKQEHILESMDSLRAQGIAVVTVDRGGDVTYHGPGQLVIYPILDLACWRKSVDWYLRALEETLLVLLHQFGLEGRRIPGYTGVWIDEEKIAAVGVSVRRWISWHGASLNVSPNEAHWKTIIPCGIRDKGQTNLARKLQPLPTMDAIKKEYIRAFRDVFNCKSTYDET